METFGSSAWDTYMRDKYPEDVKKLCDLGEQSFDVYLPIEARDERKEQEFKGRLIGDIENYIDQISKKSNFNVYKETFIKMERNALRFLTCMLAATSYCFGYVGNLYGLPNALEIGTVSVPVMVFLGEIGFFWSLKGRYKNDVNNLRKVRNNIRINYRVKI